MNSTDQRIRGRALQHIREVHFMRYPLCVHCDAKGLVRIATELDHIVPLFKGGADDSSNRQGLCGACHAIKTAADLCHKPTGADLLGYPTDPRHPWNQQANTK